MAMGFLLECSHKVDLGYFQCPNGESDLHQPNIFFVKDIKFDSYVKNMYILCSCRENYILLGFNHVQKG